ncbi:unnamed protein product [Heligmosomoides polygyrus]|uniref:YTH domain-containing protein n=1 Tax=Heligmosomoides polygyrus TaxID=6339 RepID=A0A183GL88_HELPZ|nr:unnamed protein product [Heligmosomoides polygyrus]
MNSTAAQQAFYSSQTSGQWADAPSMGGRMAFNSFGNGGGSATAAGTFDYGNHQQPVNGYNIPPPGYGQSMSFTSSGGHPARFADYIYVHVGLW